MNDYNAMLANLTSCQQRCTELLDDARLWKRRALELLDHLDKIADSFNNVVLACREGGMQDPVLTHLRVLDAGIFNAMCVVVKWQDK